MKLKLLFFTLFFFSTTAYYAQAEDSTQIDISAIEKSMKYETGIIKLSSGKANLRVPKGFKYLNAEQTQYVLSELWGNPEDKTVLGALVPENNGVGYGDSWLFTITYDDMGYVKDDDAKDVDYDELLTGIKEDCQNYNEERKNAGFETVEIIGWASTPFYDESKKVLHWAKEIRFGGSEGENTLNYDLRILGRKGVYILSAVAAMNQLPEVKTNIDNVISSIDFNEGERYADFDSSTDNVAAWTIGGLVAGKVLAKVGFFAILAKFGKFILIGLIAVGAGIKKFFFGKKEQVLTKPVLEETNASEETEDKL
jgi:uncharacterized membrane-anchored protein